MADDEANKAPAGPEPSDGPTPEKQPPPEKQNPEKQPAPDKPIPEKQPPPDKPTPDKQPPLDQGKVGSGHSGQSSLTKTAGTLPSGKTADDLADVLHKARNTVEQLKRLKGMGVGGVASAVAVATTAIANVPSMGDAVANWKGLAASLDKDANNRLNQLIAFSEKDWIAEDQREFMERCVEFRKQIEWCRAYATSCADICDEPTDAFRSYWTNVALLVGTAITAAGLASAALALPTTRIAGQLALRAVGVGLTGTIAAATAQLGSFMSTAASLFPSVYGGNAYIQIGNLKPTGPLEIDFGKAAIDQSKPDVSAPFKAPTSGPLPDGHQQFQWVVPLRKPLKTAAELDGP